MKSVVHIAFCFLAMSLVAQLAYAQVPQFTPFSADLQITSTRGEMGTQEISGKVYAGSGHVRLNLGSQGRETAVITDFATKTTDVLLVQQQMYIEHKGEVSHGRLPGNGSDDLHPYDPQNPCANQPELTCKKIGIETVSGRTCDHWEVTNKTGKVTNLWLDQTLHFPVKVVSQDSTMLLSNIHEGEPDAGLFKIPEGYRKLDVNTVMGPGGGSGPPRN